MTGIAFCIVGAALYIGGHNEQTRAFAFVCMLIGLVVTWWIEP